MADIWQGVASEVPNNDVWAGIASPLNNQQPQLSVSDYGSDIAKSAGTGLGQGAIGLITAPIDLGARAATWAGNKFGQAANIPGFPVDYPPMLTQMATNAAGLDYQPKTIPGQYANTMASFLPAAAGATMGNEAPLLKSLGIGAVSGAASEASGQLTKGTAAEPYARVAGALLPSLFGKVTSPQVTDPTKQAAMQTAEDFGIPIYRNQISDNGITKAAASLEKEVPFTGAASKVNTQTNAFNDALAGTIGQTNGPVTPELMNAAHDKISDVFNDLTNKYDMKVDPTFMQKLNLIANDASNNLVEGQESAVAKQVANIKGMVTNATSGIPSNSSGIISGEQYQNLRSNIGSMLRSSNFSPQLAGLQNLLDEQFSQGMNLSDAQALNSARSQYRNLLALEGPVARYPNSDIPPSAIQGSVKQKFGNYAYGGDSDLERLSRLGNLLKDNYPNSGTAQKSALIEGAKTLGKIGVGGALGYEALQDPEGTLGGAVGALALSRLGLTPLLYQQMTRNPSTLEKSFSGAANSLPYQLMRNRQAQQ